MGLYLDIGQVESNGSPRRLFLCNMITRKVYVYDTWCYTYMMLVIMMNMLLGYIVI